MSKILAINGSYRGDKGHTSYLIGRLFQGARGGGADCEIVTLSELRIRRCIACGVCQTQAHYLRCAYEQRDDARMIFDKMAQADLLIYATPVYVFGMSGLLKTLLERLYATGDSNDLLVTKSGLLFHTTDVTICSKPFVTLVCCDNLENETPRNVVSYFHTFARFMDAPQVGVLVRNGGRLAGYGGDPEREKRLPKIKTVYDAYEQAGRELATLGRIRRGTQQRANQDILPIPMFRLVKRFKPFKRKMLARAREML
jgi:multimeric flavodoxin WrbA